MDHLQEAERRVAACERAGTEADATTLAYVLLAAVDVLERIDDALRNTVGGSAR